MITRRSLVAGLIAAPAVVKAENLMKVYSLPQRYATVWGIGHDLEVIEHVLWEPISVGAFGGTPAIDKFREVTEWEWGFPMEPIPPAHKNPRGAYALDPGVLFNKPVDDSKGFTNITSYGQLNDWRESLRPDLDGRLSVEWIQEQIRAERKILGS